MFLYSLFCLCVVYGHLLSTDAKHLPDILWHSSNAMFQSGNANNVVEAAMHDKFTFSCVQYDDYAPESEVEHSVIYKVSKFGYENCILDDAKPVGACDRKNNRKLTFTVRIFTPVPGGLEFIPGKSYYFISASDGTQMGRMNQEGGLCKSKNLRLRFDVLPSDINVLAIRRNFLPKVVSTIQLTTPVPVTRALPISAPEVTPADHRQKATAKKFSVQDFLWHSAGPVQIQRFGSHKPEPPLSELTNGHGNGLATIQKNAYQVDYKPRSDPLSQNNFMRDFASKSSPKFSRHFTPQNHRFESDVDDIIVYQIESVSDAYLIGSASTSRVSMTSLCFIVASRMLLR